MYEAKNEPREFPRLQRGPPENSRSVASTPSVAAPEKTRWLRRPLLASFANDAVPLTVAVGEPELVVLKVKPQGIPE